MYNGQTPSRFNDDNWNGDINWLSSGELNRGVVTETVEKITAQGQKDANLKIIPKGIFVMAITGLEAAGTRGNCAILGIDTTLNQSCMAVFPQLNVLDTRFLFQWYRKVGEEYGISYTQGTKQQSYNVELVKILPITLPEIQEQKKIGGFFTELDHLITLHQRKLEQLESLRKAYLQRMFPIQNKLEPELRFCNFYDDWELCELGSIGYTYNGLTGKNKDDFGHGDAKYIPYMNVFSNPIADPAMLESIGIDKKQNHVQYGDVLFTTSSETPEDVGMSSVWMHNLNNIYLNSFCFGFHPTIEIDPYYLAYMLRSNEIRKQFRILAQGISRYNIAKIKVMKIRVPIPNIEEQKLIGNLFKELDNNISFCEQKLEMIRQLKEAYLQKMFV